MRNIRFIIHFISAFLFILAQNGIIAESYHNTSFIIDAKNNVQLTAQSHQQNKDNQASHCPHEKHCCSDHTIAEPMRPDTELPPIAVCSSQILFSYDIHIPKSAIFEINKPPIFNS